MLSAFAVKRWQFTLVVFLALCALGVQSMLQQWWPSNAWKHDTCTREHTDRRPPVPSFGR